MHSLNTAFFSVKVTMRKNGGKTLPRKAIETRVGNNYLVDLDFTALMLVFTPAIIWLFQT